MKRPRFALIPWIFVGALGALYFGKQVSVGAEKGRVDNAMPLVVEALRDTKFLRSAEMQMQETFEYTTHKQPAEWASAIPGVSSTVEAATKNQVWVAAHGTVGAGVDLSKAKVTKSATGITVTIPEAELEKPNVQLQLVGSHRGVLWDDRSITIKAQETASERFRSAARQRGLKDKALASAKETLVKLMASVTSVPIDVRTKA